MMTSSSPTMDSHRNRLPTLFEVLSRRTTAPVDLFSFYIYMRDQQRSVDYLDFWLDVSQHMSLCRHYVRELRRSVLIDTPENEKDSKRASANLDNMPGLSAAGPSQDKPSPEQRVSAFLRSDESGRRGSPARTDNSIDSSERLPRPPFLPSSNGSPHTTDTSPANNGTDSNSPMHTVSRQDIRASAEKILYTYLLPGSEREVILPQGILVSIITAVEEQGRDDPEVFDAAKDYVFQAMERDAFPGFLRSKALGNTVPPSLTARLALGLLSIFGAFWTAFILIFLDASRTTRCWVILPFTVAVYMLACHQYMLDPLLALIGISEYTLMSFYKIRDRFVRKLLFKRALMVLAVVIVVDAALCCLFIFVPGKRL